MIKLKDLLKEWTDTSFRDLPKRWSKPVMTFNEPDGLTEFERLGGKDIVKEGHPSLIPWDRWIKKGEYVWFSDTKNSAKRLKVKHIMKSKDGKENHYITNRGTYTEKDVVGY
jgi:hypothetical protein